jgi:hypothetical protein
MLGVLATSVVRPDFGDGGMLPDARSPEQSLLWLVVVLVLCSVAIARRLRGEPILGWPRPAEVCHPNPRIIPR